MYRPSWNIECTAQMGEDLKDRLRKGIAQNISHPFILPMYDRGTPRTSGRDSIGRRVSKFTPNQERLLERRQSNKENKPDDAEQNESPAKLQVGETFDVNQKEQHDSHAHPFVTPTDHTAQVLYVISFGVTLVVHTNWWFKYQKP